MILGRNYAFFSMTKVDHLCHTLFFTFHSTFYKEHKNHHKFEKKDNQNNSDGKFKGVDKIIWMRDEGYLSDHF